MTMNKDPIKMAEVTLAALNGDEQTLAKCSRAAIDSLQEFMDGDDGPFSLEFANASRKVIRCEAVGDFIGAQMYMAPFCVRMKNSWEK